MKLKRYIKLNNIRVADFAARLRVSGRSVYAYCNGERIPSRKVMIRIGRITSGLVTANDFYGGK